ncbi:MAG: hypothetical protein EB090_05945 [Verrucomicrobia bacterium]|nr:hypothetical protein [Verrucomicrobiota bacterium]
MGLREKEAFQARLKGRIALASLALLILTLMAGASLPAYRALKSWRAERLMNQADEKLKQGSLIEAYQAAKSAHGLNPQNLRSLRMLADMYEGSGAAETLLYRRSVAESSQSTTDDQANYLRAAIQSGRLDLADEFLKRIGIAGRANPKIAAITASLLRLRGETEKAKAVEEEAAQKAQGQEKTGAELIRARGQMDSQDPAERAAGRTTLLRIAMLDDPHQMEARQLLIASQDRTEKETLELIHSIEHHPKASTADRLSAKSLQLEIHPDWRSATLTEVKKTWSNGTEEEQLALAEFLSRHNDPEGVLALPPVRQGRGLLLRLDALAKLKKWAAIRDELNQASEAKVPLDPFVADVFQARVAQELREIPMAEAQWKKAKAKASGNVRKMEFLANFAERSGNIPLARETYRDMTRYPATAVPGYFGLIRIAEKNAATSELRDIMGELARQLPKDPAPKNDFAYLNLLMNDRLDDSLQSARDLVAACPDFPAYRTTLALAFLKKNQAREALAAYDGLSIDWSTALPGWQAVRAAVLAANQQADPARVLALQVNWDRLKPEERDLIRALRTPK